MESRGVPVEPVAPIFHSTSCAERPTDLRRGCKTQSAWRSPLGVPSEPDSHTGPGASPATGSAAALRGKPDRDGLDQTSSNRFSGANNNDQSRAPPEADGDSKRIALAPPRSPPGSVRGRAG